MEENNNAEKSSMYRNIEPSVGKYWKECLGMLLAAFIGGFLAIYFVADQVFDKQYRYPKHFAPDRFEREIFNDFNKMYERERKAFEHDFDKFKLDFDSDFNKHFKNDFDNNSLKKFFEGNKSSKKMQKQKSILNPFLLPDMTMDSVKIKTEFDDNKYKVIIGLKAFQGDDSKINYNVSGRKLTVFGNSTIKDKKYEQDISFSQDFILPYNADIANITKKKNDNELVIEVPLKD